jgi:hypothetical protein
VDLISPPADQAHHLPDLTSFEDVTNLLFLLNLVILGHILYHPFYTDPLRINEEMSGAWEHGRELATNVLNHINDNCCFLMENREVEFPTIVYSFLSHQMRCLIRKAKAEEGSSKGVTSALINEIAICFADCNWLPWHLSSHRRLKRSSDHYDWYDKSEYQVSTRKAGKFAGMLSPMSFKPKYLPET